MTLPTGRDDNYPLVTAFFDEATNTVSYVVRDPASNACAIVDPVLDFDYASGTIGYASAERLLEHVRSEGLELEWLIETHVHADHLSAAPWLQDRLGGRIGIGAKVVDVQRTFGKVFNEGTEFERDGSQFDRLFEDGDTYRIGSLTGMALHTPGHTPACMTHVIGDTAFVGDTLFMPDGGTARADFPGGDARTLYRSIRRVLELPPETRLFMCHDYGPDGREIRWETTVAEERAHNVHVADGIDEEEFVRMREARDATLDMPKLILPSLQVNMRAGHFPAPEDDGQRYLKVPVKGLDETVEGTGSDGARTGAAESAAGGPVMTPVKRLDADVAVSAQLSAADLAGVADAGFRSVICNRPDGEESGQSTFAELEAAARAAGLEMVHQPVASGTIDDAAARAFETHLETLPSPTLAFCRSGTRSASLWALATAPRRGVADVLAATRAAGYDLATLLPRPTHAG